MNVLSGPRRFLRARRFDPAKAQKQFAEWIAWRKEWDVDNLFANFDEDEFEASRRYYPRWTGRRDIVSPQPTVARRPTKPCVR